MKTIPGFSASVRAYADKKCYFGKYCKIGKDVLFQESSMDDFSYVSGYTKIKKCNIGKFCSIGPYALIGGLGIHPTHWLSTHPAFFSTLGQSGRRFSVKNYFKEDKFTHIGNDVWIGARVIILDGITICDGAIIGAGAVVTKDVEPYTVVGGVPAKKIKKRFSDDVCNALQEIKWWDADPNMLSEYYNKFIEKECWTVEDIAELKKLLRK